MRQRSHWAWGWADAFPDDDMRRSLAAMVAARLGVDAPTLLPLPNIDDARIPQARIIPPSELSVACDDTREGRIRHTYGRAYPDLLRGFAGDFMAAPDFVVLPKNEQEVFEVLQWASKAKVAVVPYGGGTSVVAGVEASGLSPAFNGVVALDLRDMNQVLEIDVVARAARIQAGALGPHLEKQLEPHGLSLRHFPQSFEFSTLGGWLATRAGGHFATLYTHIDDLVQSMTMVTPKGTFSTRRLPASGAGPAPDRWVLGSEGTFGVITEAWLRLHERPRFRRGFTAYFEHYDDAVHAAHALSQSALYPTNCRLLDAEEAALNLVTPPGQTSHVLIVAFESANRPRDEAIGHALAICTEAHGLVPQGIVSRDRTSNATPQDGAAQWRSAFIDAPYLQSALVSLGAIADTFETACTWSNFQDVDHTIRAAVGKAMAEVSGGGILSCRFTHVYPDGPAPYYTFICAGKSGHLMEQWQRIKWAACEAIARSGATITHHHAVGRTHKRWYAQEVPQLFGAAMRGAKAAVDPEGVMNPGVLW